METTNVSGISIPAGHASPESRPDGDYVNLRQLQQACQMASHASTTAMEEALPLKRILTAGKGELRCAGHRYAVTVHVDRNDVWVSARRLDLPPNRLLRFLSAVRDVFKRGTFRTRADAVGQLLTAVARSAPAAGVIVPVPPARAGGTAGASNATQKERAETAIKAIRAKHGVRLRTGRAGIPEEPKVDLARIAPAGMDWSGIDLSRLDLSGTCLRNFNLAGANLAGTVLDNTDLSGANLTGANLCGAKMLRTTLSNANLVGADLKGAQLKYVSFSHANCAGVDFSSTPLDLGVDFSDSCLVGANFAGRHFLLTPFVRANLTRADLRRCHFADVALDGARLVEARLDGAELGGVSLTGANCRDAQLHDVRVRWGQCLKGFAEAGARDIRMDTNMLQNPGLQTYFLNPTVPTASLQRNIDAIDDEGLKVGLMRQLVGGLAFPPDDPNIAPLIAVPEAYRSVLTVLTGNSLYREDDDIGAWAGTCSNWLRALSGTQAGA